MGMRKEQQKEVKKTHTKPHEGTNLQNKTRSGVKDKKKTDRKQKKREELELLFNGKMFS